jgi:hypothetical protein
LLVLLLASPSSPTSLKPPPVTKTVVVLRVSFQDYTNTSRFTKGRRGGSLRGSEHTVGTA